VGSSPTVRTKQHRWIFESPTRRSQSSLSKQCAALFAPTVRTKQHRLIFESPTRRSQSSLSKQCAALFAPTVRTSYFGGE
jgi:hypothetical protein